MKLNCKFNIFNGNPILCSTYTQIFEKGDGGLINLLEPEFYI